MIVDLRHHTPLHVAAGAIRTCWDSGEKSDSELSHRIAGVDHYNCGPKDKELIHRVGNKYKHNSTLEHLSYTFWIEGVSRALLQELARHRIASPSVKSTRYTLKELKKELPFSWINGRDALYDRVSKYCVLTGVGSTDRKSALALENLREEIANGVSNDIAKYCLPDSYKTSLTWTINARSLQNFLSLRSSKSALWEIRQLAQAVFEAIPTEHQYLFEEFMNEPKD